MKHRARGFTLFEFAVCASLCALLAGALLSRLREYHAQSERLAVEHVAAAIRTAMSLRTAQGLVASCMECLPALAQENPIAWLARRPDNYQGEFYRPPRDLLKPGHWYFDHADKTVNFLHSNDTFSLGTSKLLKFKVELLREPVLTRAGGRTEAIQGLVFTQVHERAASTDH